jgi:hypothetical protein
VLVREKNFQKMTIRPRSAQAKSGHMKMPPSSKNRIAAFNVRPPGRGSVEAIA